MSSHALAIGDFTCIVLKESGKGWRRVTLAARPFSQDTSLRREVGSVPPGLKEKEGL